MVDNVCASLGIFNIHAMWLELQIFWPIPDRQFLDFNIFLSTFESCDNPNCSLFLFVFLWINFIHAILLCRKQDIFVPVSLIFHSSGSINSQASSIIDCEALEHLHRSHHRNHNSEYNDKTCQTTAAADRFTINIFHWTLFSLFLY